MKQLIKNCTYLIRQPIFPMHRCKTCFLILWFNCEFRIETGNEKHKRKCPTNSRISDYLFKNKTPSLFSFQGGKGNHVKTLEVYHVKTLEVYTVKTLEVQYVTTLEVYTVKTLEVFCYQNVHWR